MNQIKIKNGKILDGTGNPWYKSTITIKKNKIEKIGENKEETDKVIDAEGKFVAPGFIDLHSHSDLIAPYKPELKPKVMQGITTEITGNCGIGLAPVNEKYKEELKDYLSSFSEVNKINWKWNTLEEYMNYLEKLKTTTNLAYLIPHGTLRLSVMGFKDREPKDSELRKMKEIIQEGMNEGFFGISTGLEYPPGSFSNTEELIELTKKIKENNGYYASHMRSESKNVLKSIKEVIKISEKANVPAQVSHLKAEGKDVWGYSKKMKELIDKTREKNDVKCDLYPYKSFSTNFASILPDWAQDGTSEDIVNRLKNSEKRKKIIKDIKNDNMNWNPIKTTGWSNIRVTGLKSEKYRPHDRSSIQKISEKTNKGPYETAFDILIKEKSGGIMIGNSMSEKDIKNILQYQYTSICTDGLDIGKNPHPRLYGSFPKVIQEYALKKNYINIEEAIRKMTSLPAQRLGLKKGIIAEDYDADITIFNPKTIKDKSSFKKPRKYPKGIEHVIINGEIAVKNGEYTKQKPGKILKNKRNQPKKQKTENKEL